MNFFTVINACAGLPRRRRLALKQKPLLAARYWKVIWIEFNLSFNSIIYKFNMDPLTGPTRSHGAGTKSSMRHFRRPTFWPGIRWGKVAWKIMDLLKSLG
jgi:hypothetical protein